MIYIETIEDSFEFDISCDIEYEANSYWIFVRDPSSRLLAALPKNLINSIEYEYDED